MVGQEGDPPDKPTGLTGTIAHDQVILIWDDPDDETDTSYQILRRDTAIHEIGRFEPLMDDTGNTDTTYTDTTVEPGQRYVYRVKARNANGLSDWSSYFNAKVPAGPPPPAAPTGLTGTVAHDLVTLTWNDPDDDITGYKILRRNRGTDPQSDFTALVNDTDTADTSYTDTTVEAEARYAYRIHARNGELLSGMSGKFVADVPLPPPVAVSFQKAAYAVAEGESVTVTVLLDKDPKRDLVIPIEASNQGDASDVDYSGVPADVIFSAGETGKEIALVATDDEEDDDGESVLLSFGAPLPYRVSEGNVNETEVSITDNDLASTPTVMVNFKQSDYPVIEGEQVTITVTLDVAADRALSISISIFSQTDAATSDYSGVPETVDFGEADLQASFTVTTALTTKPMMQEPWCSVLGRTYRTT